MQSRSKTFMEITTQPVQPDNSGYTWIYDSTDARMGTPGLSLGKTAAVRAVGPARGAAKGLRAMIGACCTTQDVAIVCYTLDGAGAWRLYSSDAVVAAAVPKYVSVTIPSPDFLIGILAGATKPATVSTTLILTEQP